MFDSPARRVDHAYDDVSHLQRVQLPLTAVRFPAMFLQSDDQRYAGPAMIQAIPAKNAAVCANLGLS